MPINVFTIGLSNIFTCFLVTLVVARRFGVEYVFFLGLGLLPLAGDLPLALTLALPLAGDLPLALPLPLAGDLPLALPLAGDLPLALPLAGDLALTGDLA